MHHFIIKLLIFIVVPLPVLFGFEYLADSGLRKSRNEFFSEWNDIYSGSINADLIIMGSSRAWVHISPKILDERLKINTYNLGINANPFPMQNARFKIYLEHNRKPKYIIQTLETNILTQRKDLIYSQQYIPYLNDPIIRSATKNYQGKFNNAHFLFPLAKYNDNWPYFLLGLKTQFGLVDDAAPKYKGYQGQDWDWDGNLEKVRAANPNGIKQEVDPLVLAEFEDYLSFCKENDIKVFLVYTPEFVEGQKLIVNRSEIIEIFQNLGQAYQIPFLDYSQIPLSKERKYFYNSEHLNRSGAELFSEILAHDLPIGVHID
jgi:hypothetical protein